MKNKSILLSLSFLGGVLALQAMGASPPGTLHKMQFVPGEDSARLEIQYAGNANFHAGKMNQNMQVVVEADNLVLAPEQTKVLDTSNLQTPMIQVTPYNSGEKIPRAKFVVQFRQAVPVTIEAIPGKFTLEIKGDYRGQRAQNEPGKARKQNNLAPATKEWVENDTLVSRASAEDRSQDIARQLLETLESPSDQKIYHGTKVTFEASDASVHDVFRLIGETSGLNIITTDKVNSSPHFSISLKDLPWDQVMDIVLQQGNLKTSIIGNVVRVATLDEYNSEQNVKVQALKIGLQMDPVILSILPLSYAKADEMKKILTDIIVKDGGQGALPLPGVPGAPAAAGAPGAGSENLAQAFVRGTIDVDTRSNSLIITNTKNAIERIRKLVKELDVPLPQVLIDAKIVIASEDFAKNIGVNYSAGATGASGRSGAGASFNGGALSLANTSGSNDAAPAFSVTSTPQTSLSNASGTFGFQLGAGQRGNLNVQLQLGELQGVSKTIASPRVVVNNKQAAEVTDGTKIAVTTPGTPTTPATTTFTTAALDLQVTPQITSAGSVLLDLDLKKDAPSSSNPSNIDTKEVKTQVLVDSGATLVLGGVYQFGGNSNSSGIPLLMDLPFIGGLFRVDSQIVHKDELMVFLTPQILDTGGSGITTGKM